jgi:hypothetical protein
LRYSFELARSIARRYVLSKVGKGRYGVDLPAYEAGLAQRVDEVFRNNPDLHDHRRNHSGVTGCLGDPFARVWFVAEFPSLGRIEQQGAASASPEAQWNTSPGDRLFRAALAEAGFKTGGPDTPGGWRCYVTNLIKAAEHVGQRRATKPIAVRMADARLWAPVLRWQLEVGAPDCLVLMGGTVADLFRHLVDHRAVPLPPQVERIESYASVAARPQGGLGPLHPDRVAAYRQAIAAIARGAGLAPPVEAPPAAF